MTQQSLYGVCYTKGQAGVALRFTQAAFAGVAAARNAPSGYYALRLR
jgi:hypothetical protein